MKRRGERGFVLLAVILVIAIVSATVTLSLRQSSDALQQSAGLRASALSSTALAHGLDAALAKLQGTDPASLLSPPLDGQGRSEWDIFDAQNATNGWLGNTLSYPPDGPFKNEFTVRVGLRMGQKTQAPPGEDAVSGYGYVVELQLSASTQTFGQAAEEQVAIGVQVPQANSYAK